MTRRTAAFLVLLAAAAVAGASSGNMKEPPAQCLLRLLDDRGRNVAESVTICRADQPENCWGKAPGNTTPRVDIAALRVEGDGHGPVTVQPEKADDGICTITVPRKAEVTISFDTEPTGSLEASFYCPDDDPDLFQPAHQASVERATSIRVPAGPYVLSMTARGWAPDLRLLDATPGSEHKYRYRQRDGWSVVLRTVADYDGTPVAEAAVEIRTLPGFDEPGRVPLKEKPTDEEPKTRTLLERRSNASGLAVASGLRVPVAGAKIRHKDFLDAAIPAFSSETGTFRVFEARLNEGGGIAVRVVREALAAVSAHCELAPPELERVPPWGLQEPLYETQADFLGVCRATKIPAGRYALKVSLTDASGAYTIQPIVIEDGHISESTVEMWPITVTGRVLQGEQGASGYEVKFDRNSPLELDAPFYPAGRTTTDDDGNYELVLWSPGEYLGQVSTESATAGNFRLVELYGDETVDFRLAQAELEGQVVAESGAPRPAARLTIKWLDIYRSVHLDEDARFRISFRDESGMAEIQAVEDGFRKSEPVTVMIDKDLTPPPITVVIRRRHFRAGRVILPSGQPAAGVTVSAHRLEADAYAYAIDRRVSDETGRIDIPFEPGALRIFYGGPGCALGSFDLAPIASDTSGEALTVDEPPFEIVCEPPSHLIVHLITDDPELRSGSPILLRRGDVVVPPEVLKHHLLSLGLPSTTDGQGQVGLIALAPGPYDVYHGKGTSYRNLLDRVEIAKLASITLGINATVEIAVTLDFRLDKMDARLAFPGNQ